MSLLIGLLAFCGAFGGAILGLYLRNVLPEHHLSKESRDAVMMGTGLIATLTALVLGLLISSAKDSFDTVNTSLMQSGAKIIMLDRTLSQYGPDAAQARLQLKRTLVRIMNRIWPEENIAAADAAPNAAPASMEKVQDLLRQLPVTTDLQRSLQANALQSCYELLEARWLAVEQGQRSMPTAFLVILFFWLTILFICIGLFAPPNKTVIAVMLVCAISVGGAVFLVREMNNPLKGVMKISSAPLIKAYSHLGK
jgi:hypothetical protein